MASLGTYCGATLLNKNETNIKNNIKLEYYSIEREINIKSEAKTLYGISIIKKEYCENRVSFEKSSVEKVSTNRNVVMSIIKVLKNCKVTPIALKDVVEDLLKQNNCETA